MVNSQEVPRLIRKATGLSDSLIVLEIYFMLPFSKYLYSNCRSVCLERFLYRFLLEKLMHFIHFLHCLWLLGCPDTNKNPLRNCVIAHIFGDFVSISCLRKIC